MSFPWKRRPSPSRSLAEAAAMATFSGGYEELLRQQLAALGLPGRPAPSGFTPKKALAPDGLPSGAQDEPIRASKAAYLVMDESGVTFAALHRGRRYGPQSVAGCHCGDGSLFRYSYLGMTPSSLYDAPAEHHEKPTPSSKCGFYAWKPEVPFPWQAGTWLLETDLYGTVIEHEHGYRAQKQRVLSVSPVPELACEPPFGLVLGPDEGRITAVCGLCPPGPAHPLSVERLRAMLGVEIDLERAWNLREKGIRP